MLIAAKRNGTTGAVHCVESVLKRGYERAFARGEGHEELAVGGASDDPDGPGNTQRHPREADESLDAAGQLFRVDFSARRR